MAQAHPASALVDPGLLQTLSLLEPLEVPVAVVDAAGYILYESAAFSAFRAHEGVSHASHLLLRDWVVPVSPASSPFLKFGALNFTSLPYSGRCRLVARPARGASRKAVMMRLTAFTDANGNSETALCTITQEHSNVHPLIEPDFALLRTWQGKIEEIGDSFDVERIGSKVCHTLKDITSARASAFYWLDGDTWRRAEQVGVPGTLPETVGTQEPWVTAIVKQSPTSFDQLTAANPGVPDWVSNAGDGFAMACKARGDNLGLAFVWSDVSCLRTPAVVDLLGLVAFEAAQAVDYARWFQFARQSDSRSEQFFDNANAIILGMDLRGNITLWNRKAQEILGYSRDETLGRPPSVLFGGSPAQSHAIRDRFERILHDSKESLVAFELAMRDKDGRRHDIEWNTSLLTSTQGTVLGCYAIGQDVTRRKELELSLAASEKRYRNLVESTHDIYWTIRLADADEFESGVITFMNRAFAGHNRESLESHTAEAFRKAFSLESWQRFSRACLQVFETGRPVHHIETDHIRPGAEQPDTFLLSDLFPHFEDELLVGVQGLSIDVTERKRIEEQSLQAQKLESIGTLAQGVSHDFNNILNGISGFAYLIERAAATDSAKVLANIRSIKQLTERASRLTRQLQTYANQNSAQKRALDLNEVVRQSVNILDISVAKQSEVTIDLADNLPWIDGDRSQIEQILLNLFINAVEAMKETGTLKVTTRLLRHGEPDQTLPHDVPAGDYSVLEVRDTGCGMPPEVRNRIFDPFFTTKRTGHGLGLSSVFGIVRKHDAFIKVDSEVGVGTCFTIYFPAVVDSHRLLGNTADQKVRGGNETILFVDDESSIRMVSEDILSGLGYRVVLAENGEDAIQIFQARPQAIDLVLVDVAMPVLNGRAAAKIMRMARPDLKILFTSGHCDAEMIEALRDEGFPNFLAKPYSMAELQAAVRKTLDAERTVC